MKQPTWVRGRVPNGYWSTRPNRLKYLKWLGQRLRYRRLEDWYDLTRRSLLDNYGGGLLATVYNHSTIEALRDLKPNHDWKPWLMKSTPQGYWRDPKNRRAFMKYLGGKLGFTRPEHWYALSQGDFHAHGGGGVLGMYYRNSPIDAVREFLPNFEWQEWKFVATPQGFWKKRECRKRYMDFLAKQLGVRKPSDWYSVTRRDFYENAGGALLHQIPGHSPLAALREYLPDEDWLEWRFARVPNGFWKERKNRHRFIDFLGDELGYRKTKDWYGLTRAKVRKHGGAALLSMHYHNSLLALLRDRFPNVAWDPEELYGSSPASRRLAA